MPKNFPICPVHKSTDAPQPTNKLIDLKSIGENVTVDCPVTTGCPVTTACPVTSGCLFHRFSFLWFFYSVLVVYKSAKKWLLEILNSLNSQFTETYTHSTVRHN